MKQFIISNNDFHEILLGNNSSYKNEKDHIVLKNLFVHNEHIIETGDFKKTIIFKNVTFNNRLIIKGGNFENLQFRNSHNISIYNGIINNLKIDDTESAGDSISYNFLGNNNLKIKDFFLSSYRTTIVSQALIERVNVFFKNYPIIFDGNEIDELIIRGTYIKEKKVSFMVNKVKHIKFQDCDLGNFELSSFNTFDNGTLSFVRARFIDNVRIYNIDFSKYKIKNFLNSDIVNLKLTNSYFPVKAERSIQKNDLLLYYRNLKIVTKNEEDYGAFSEFRAYEYDTYLKTLDFKFRNIPKIILLFLNRITNFHGTYYIIPFIEIFLVGFIFYLLYLKSISFQLQGNIGEFFSFILPIHSIDFICDTCNTGKSIIIDSIHRIINSYLIYQMIVAFRRYGR